MRKLFLKAYQHPLFAGSALMLIGSNVASALNYVYHLLMGRFLSPAQYGELSALFSLINLIGIIPQSLNLLIIKFISQANKKNEIKGLISWFSKRIAFFTISVFLLISAFSKVIADFLNIDDSILIILTALTFIFSLQTFLYRSVLQGLLNFKAVILTTIFENGIKLISGIFLVYMGYAVFGAVVGVILAGLLAMILTSSLLKDFTNPKEEIKPDTKEIFNFTLPVLGQSVAAASLISSDLILVKHFFNPQTAGLYAAVATLGKIIFFATGPVLSVMLPLIAKRKTLNQNYKQIFLLSLMMNLLITLTAVTFFHLFPNLVVSLLYGSNYIGAVSYLSMFGIFIVFYTIANLFINYFLMLGRVKVVYIYLFAALAQVVGISLFHNDLFSVILTSISVTLTLVLILIFLYFKD